MQRGTEVVLGGHDLDLPKESQLQGARLAKARGRHAFGTTAWLPLLFSSPPAAAHPRLPSLHHLGLLPDTDWVAPGAIRAEAFLPRCASSGPMVSLCSKHPPAWWPCSQDPVALGSRFLLAPSPVPRVRLALRSECLSFILGHSSPLKNLVPSPLCFGTSLPDYSDRPFSLSGPSAAGEAGKAGWYTEKHSGLGRAARGGRPAVPRIPAGWACPRLPGAAFFLFNESVEPHGPHGFPFPFPSSLSMKGEQILKMT